jgi:tellurite resistance protein
MFTEVQKQNRGKALAEAFFFRMDRELIASLSRKLDREEKIRSFGAMTGIQDPKIVECLVDAGFELSTLTAFIWAPVVFVAWADGNADQSEKIAILHALPSRGVSQEVASMMIAHEWFANCPTEELWQLWEEFAAASLAGINIDEREGLTDEIVNLCYVVAHASGGFLGFGKVSQSESEVIDRVITSLKAIASSDESVNELKT